MRREKIYGAEEQFSDPLLGLLLGYCEIMGKGSFLLESFGLCFYLFQYIKFIMFVYFVWGCHRDRGRGYFSIWVSFLNRFSQKTSYRVKSKVVYDIFQ